MPFNWVEEFLNLRLIFAEGRRLVFTFTLLDFLGGWKVTMGEESKEGLPLALHIVQFFLTIFSSLMLYGVGVFYPFQFC